MLGRTIKLRWRRRFRRSRRQVEDLGLQAEENLERNFFRRLSRLVGVRRFIGGWLLLVGALLIGVVLQVRALGNYYQTIQPAPGGAYTEGILGAFTNANPLYASGGVDGAVAKLVFSGLLKYDSNDQLVGDLADTWGVDATETNYTVHLRPNLQWHDGRALTADDVVFTYQTIQNPDARSPLLPSWQGIKVAALDPQTIVFTLPNSFSSFPFALTNGIVPKHLLADSPASQLRSLRFNTANPVGSGPFKWGVIETRGTNPEDRQEIVGLTANPNYHGGVPALQRLTIRSFRGEQQLVKSFEDHELNAMIGLTEVPETLQRRRDVQEHSIPITGEVLVFFKTSLPVFSDPKVRQALIKGADTNAIIQGLSHAVVAARSPLLQSHVGYDKNITQFPSNLAEANALLDAAGWPKDAEGYRVKNGERLSFKLYAQSTSEYQYVTSTLQKQWRALGVDAQVILQDDNELQISVAGHGYDALLYGISLGTDPDVFAYWHSSQADATAATRLNFSEYRSAVADKALEAGRTRSDAALRAAKYKPFLEAWRNDAPALVLYQPRLLYITRGNLYGFNPKTLNNATERFSNVENWMVREVKASN